MFSKGLPPYLANTSLSLTYLFLHKKWLAEIRRKHLGEERSSETPLESVTFGELEEYVVSVFAWDMTHLDLF